MRFPLKHVFSLLSKRAASEAFFQLNCLAVSKAYIFAFAAAMKHFQETCGHQKATVKLEIGSTGIFTNSKVAFMDYKSL